MQLVDDISDTVSTRLLHVGVQGSLPLSCPGQGADSRPVLQVCQAYDQAEFCRQSHADAAWRQEATRAVLHLGGGHRPCGQL